MRRVEDNLFQKWFWPFTYVKRKKEETKELDMLCSNQTPNALNMNRGLLIQYIDQRKSENTLRKFAVASKWGNFIQYFMESVVPDI